MNDPNAFAERHPSNAGRIRLMHHDARWRQEFEQTRSGILQCCAGRIVAVEHIGSTSVGGIIAQPIIDAVAVVADPVDFNDAILLAQGLNFRCAALPPWAENSRRSQQMLLKPRHGEATHRLYFVTQGSPIQQRATDFRDYLRTRPEVAIEFETAKVDAWRRVEGEPAAYGRAMAKIFHEFCPPG